LYGSSGHRSFRAVERQGESVIFTTIACTKPKCRRTTELKFCTFVSDKRISNSSGGATRHWLPRLSIAGPGVLEGKNETSIYLPSHPTVGACFLQARTKPVASGMPGPTRPSGPPGPAEQCLCRHRGCQQPRDPRQRSGPALGGLACFRIRRTHHPPDHGYLWLFLGGGC
jgi:hypothetical protein